MSYDAYCREIDTREGIKYINQNRTVCPMSQMVKSSVGIFAFLHSSTSLFGGSVISSVVKTHVLRKTQATEPYKMAKTKMKCQPVLHSEKLANVSVPSTLQ